MSQKKLMDDLKKKNFSPCYLLYGEESFLVAHYANTIEKAVFPDGVDPLFRDVFEEKTPAYDITMAAETVPFLAEKKMVLVKNSGLFESGRKDDSAAIAEYLPKIPDTTVVVFTESKADKRSKLFKEISKYGTVVECTPPTPNDLSTWVTRTCKEKGKQISPSTANFLVRFVGSNMWALVNEIGKVAAFAGEEITVKDIEAICTPTLESRIFDLTKAMFKGQTSIALDKYHDMLRLKESPIGILTMIIRQFRIALIAKGAKKSGMTIGQTAVEFKLHDFAVSEALEFSNKFTEDELVDALQECLELDVKMKTGLIEPELGAELLIVRYGRLS